MFDVDRLEAKIEDALQKNICNYQKCTILSDESLVVIRVSLNGETISRGLEFDRVNKVVQSIVEDAYPEYEYASVLDMTLNTRVFVFYNFKSDKNARHVYPNKVSVTF